MILITRETYLCALSDRDIRVAYVGLTVSSVAAAAFMPYQSIVAVDLLGFSDTQYSVIAFLSAIVSLLMSVLIGVISDRHTNRFYLIAHACMVGAAGALYLYVLRDKPSYLVAVILLMPVSATVGQQSFALIRSRASQLSSEAYDMVNAFARLMFVSSWIVAPPAVALLYDSGYEMLSVYLIAGLAFVAAATLFYVVPARTCASVTQNVAATEKFWLSTISPLGAAAVQLKILCNSLLRAVMVVHQMFIGLFLVHDLGGNAASVGIAAGMVAALELPLIVVWVYLLRYMSKESAIFVAALVYAGYLFALPFASTVGHVYWLLPLNAVGVACLLSVTISYMQEAIPDRPGLGTSLNSVSGIIGAGLAAALFAVGVRYCGYAGTSVLAGCIAIVAAAGFHWLGRQRRHQEGKARK